MSKSIKSLSKRLSKQQRRERRQRHRDIFTLLCHMQYGVEEGPLEEVLDPSLLYSTLESLFICRSDCLNVDDDRPIDFAPRFFAPHPRSDEDGHDFRELAKSLRRWDEGENGLVGTWPQRCCARLSTCASFDIIKCAPDECEYRRMCGKAVTEWHIQGVGNSIFRDGIITKTPWNHGFHMFRNGTGKDILPTYDSGSARTSYLRRQGHEDAPEAMPTLHEYVCEAVFELKEGDGRPHIAGVVWDTANASDAVLRSELDLVLRLMKYQLRCSKYYNHHTVPVLVFSFHHNETARITQAHMSGDKLILRQSRLLNVNADEPTEDAYLLLRWIASQPIGNTEYPEPVDETRAVATPRPKHHESQSNGVVRVQG